jgi:EAL domain-containing protein (putative c-di-GMP-specific phosphodiesterase class I)
VLIEGVENEEQLRVLKQMDIQWIQGYLRGRPVPIEELGQVESVPSATPSVSEGRKTASITA